LGKADAVEVAAQYRVLRSGGSNPGYLRYAFRSRDIRRFGTRTSDSASAWVFVLVAAESAAMNHVPDSRRRVFRALPIPVYEMASLCLVRSFDLHRVEQYRLPVLRRGNVSSGEGHGLRSFSSDFMPSCGYDSGRSRLGTSVT